MVADAPGNVAVLAVGSRLVRLTLNARVHDVVTTNGAIVHHHVFITHTYIRQKDEQGRWNA